MLNLDDRVTAAAIAAAGTVIGTLIQLHITWRREVSERARGVPASKKSRRGPVLAVGLLLVGGVVVGFASSQYLARQSDLESAAMRGQLQAQLAQMNATAARIERAYGRWSPWRRRDGNGGTVPHARRRCPRCATGVRRAGSTANHALRDRADSGRRDGDGPVRTA